MGTPQGVARVEFRRSTLREKAEFYQQAIAQRFLRHGFVANHNLLGAPGDLRLARPRITDNDGGWTGVYVAAQAFRYAATGEEAAHSRAWESARALLSLQEVTGVPGVVARCIAYPGEDQPQPDRGDYKQWHRAPDGRWWKGDASSDELVGHFFGLSVFHDLAARDQEKAKVSAGLKAIMDRMIEHGYNFVDVDGAPTRWGIFNPTIINHDPRWEAERALSSLELLSFLKTTYHVTGDPLYQEHYLDVAFRHHYALNTIDTHDPPYADAYWDVKLALFSLYPLLRYENDPGLLDIYREALRRLWYAHRRSRSPVLYYFTAALLGTSSDLMVAAQELREIPVDLIRWTIDNSWRQDIRVSSARSTSDEPQAEEPVRAAERHVAQLDVSPYILTYGSRGTQENAGSDWLLAYWCARYYGFILEPPADLAEAVPRT